MGLSAVTIITDHQSAILAHSSQGTLEKDGSTSLTPRFSAWHCPHLFSGCFMFSNLQVIEAVIVRQIIWPRFLTDDRHGQYIVEARPVGRIGIRAGQTGRPAPHPAIDENRHEPCAKPRRDIAAGLSGVERAQSRLPLFQS